MTGKLHQTRQPRRVLVETEPELDEVMLCLKCDGRGTEDPHSESDELGLRYPCGRCGGTGEVPVRE